jgi:hypothetical protein
MNFFKLYNFYADQWSVWDSTEQEEGTTVAGGVAWRLGVVVELMQDSSSSEYMEVWCFDELKVAENIRQGGVYCICVEYLYELGYIWTQSCIRCG